VKPLRQQAKHAVKTLDAVQARRECVLPVVGCCFVMLPLLS
jgi:hypothetical protein